MNELFEYCRAPDALHFTPEQKAAIAARTAEAASRESRRGVLRAGIIAACLALVLAAGAGAAGVLLSAAEAFAPIFGGTVAQTEVIGKIGRPIGASDTDNGVTITVGGPLKMGTVTAEFQDLCYYDSANARIPLAEGHWKFHFDMSYEDASINLGNGETFTQSGMDFTITEVTVSPVAVQVAYEVDSEVVWSDAPSGRLPEEDRRQMERYMENVEILLTKTDGTVMDLSLSGGSIAPRDGKNYCTKGEVLNEIIPLEELASISVGGVVYPISAD